MNPGWRFLGGGMIGSACGLMADGWRSGVATALLVLAANIFADTRSWR